MYASYDESGDKRAPRVSFNDMYIMRRALCLLINNS
jgi:hypothetical protein